MTSKTIFLLALLFLAGIFLLSVFPLATPVFNQIIFPAIEGGPIPADAPILEIINSRLLIHQGLFGWQRAAIGVAAYIFMVISGAIILYCFPGRIRRMAGEICREWAEKFRLILTGFLSILGMLALGFLGFFAVCAAPFSIMLFLSFLVVLWVGWVTVAFVLGGWLAGRIGIEGNRPLLSLGVGLLVLHVCAAVPILGWIPLLFCALLGAGAGVYTKLGSENRWSLKELTNG
jgi:hypothetical protein